MPDNRAELILAIRDEISSGMAKIQAAAAQTKESLNSLGTGGSAAGAGLASVTTSAGGMGSALEAAHGTAAALIGQLAALVGVSLSVAGAFELFKKGIEEVNSFNLQSISAAAMMLSRANIQGIDAQQAAYGQYKNYVLGMYHELEAETQRHFASGQEMIQAFNAFAIRGIYAAHDEAGAVGVVTDAVKLLHGGFVDQMTMMHEIQGVLEGHAGRYFRLAEILRGQLGPDWKEIVQTHIQDGTLLTFLAEQFKGLSVASGDIQQTLTAQSTTLSTLLGQVARGGLGGAYADIVGYVKEINEYLREHTTEIATNIVTGWERTKELVHGIYGAVKMIVDVLAVPINWTINVIGSAAKWLASGSTGGTSAFGGEGNDFYFNQAQNQQAAAPKVTTPSATRIATAEYGGNYMLTPYGKFPTTQESPPPPWSPAKPAETGGKGTEGAENSMLSLTDRLNQEIAKMSEGGIAAIDAWFNKTVDDIDKLVAKGADGSEAMALAEQSAALKKEKVTDEFYQAMAKEAGDAYMGIELWQAKALKDWQGVKDKITGQPIDVSAWVNQATEKKYYEQTLKDWEKMTSLQEKYLGGMAAASPFLSQQLELEGQSLVFQEALANSKLEDLIYHEKLNDEWRVSRGLAALMTPEMEAQLRYYEAQTQELKRQALLRKEWETQGLAGYAQSWAFDRVSGMDKQGMADFKSMMSGGESWLGDNFGKAAYNSMMGQKQQFQKLWQDILSSAVTWAFKNDAKIIGDVLAQSIKGQGGSSRGGGLTGGIGAPSGGLGSGAGSGAAPQGGEGSFNAYNWDEIAGHWEKVATQNQGAGEGLSASATQGTLAAGGMLLAGVGVATGSQALVYAGMALSLAATLLQLAAYAGIFHEGGVVAHSGMIVAHGGLAPDERLILAQTGEGIIKRATMQAYGRAGISFDDLNSGRLPVTALPVPVPVGVGSVGGAGGGGTPQVVQQQHSLRLVIATPEGQVLGQHEFNLIISETQKRLDHGEIRIPARAVRKS